MPEGVADVILDVQTRKCSSCFQAKPLSNFSLRGGNRKGYQSKCKACFVAIHYAKQTSFLVWQHAIKLDRGCADCGYRENGYALQWDHLPGKPKNFEISTGASRSRAAVEAEMAACEVVCANCHSIRSVERQHGRTH